jgi:aspartate carbamoyltransferase catalytic subunit
MRSRAMMALGCGIEIAAEVADSAKSTVVEQVTNGVSVWMAVLYLLLGGAELPGRAL